MHVCQHLFQHKFKPILTDGRNCGNVVPVVYFSIIVMPARGQNDPVSGFGSLQRVLQVHP